ncbi:WXG100 family type VII secretion target [Saccharothrix sp. ALI-22-I]|uniref:WXG100 family type VII secretion target n=1 Tax=Saccharothrix sp. ALI-22-I TaxID=1933778 RepID=UPI00097C2751|nr:WXG100 family type VII secretion target [Saccharothrix sp. ALI-22-I]ONI83926.1 WXG100 family type VII secretion target [Saccharothrix sp. ALI-22-I]
MVDNIKVDFAALSGAAGDIQGQASKIESELENLKARLSPVIAQWEGAASGTYQDAQNRWNESAAGLQQVLAQIGSAVASATDAYQAAERKNADRW